MNEIFRYPTPPDNPNPRELLITEALTALTDAYQKLGEDPMRNAGSLKTLSALRPSIAELEEEFLLVRPGSKEEEPIKKQVLELIKVIERVGQPAPTLKEAIWQWFGKKK